jgi:methionyl-tRNA formyltransferase
MEKIDTRKVPTIFMGSPQYAAEILRALYAAGQNIIAIITQPDKQVGRGKQIESPPVKVLAEELGVPCLQPEKLATTEFYGVLSGLAPELIIVAAYGKILRSPILDYPKYGCINVHASLLPRWRGASPIQAAILHGDAQSGVTIMKMDTGIDTGAIISSRTCPIENEDTAETLGAKLADLGASLLVDTLPAYLSAEKIPVPQAENGATYAGLIKKEDGLIDFSRPAEQIERMVRALHPWPNAYLDWNGSMLKIYAAKVLDSHEFEAGQRGRIEKYPCIGTASKDLMLCELQAPGKKRVDGKVFLNGAHNW